LQTILAKGPDLALKTLQFGEALRAYVLSDIPVIALVDFGRMCGVELQASGPVKLNDDHLFSRNRVGDALEVVTSCRNQPDARTRNHAVLVVGCQCVRNQDPEHPIDLFVNDPSTYPFLRVPVSELVRVRTYEESSWAKGVLGPIQFISVTPQEVRLPLMM
jgi:hypothetical protein